MKKQYHIDLTKFSLRQLKSSLQNRELIPSRVILKEKLEERFNTLKINGIKNLQDLADALKTKQKIETFSKKADLPVDYLTILNREAKSYLPSPKRLKDFPGIDSKDIDALESIGIKNTKQLFNKGKNAGEVKKLSQLTGIPIDKLNELVALSDLARLYGVGPVFARIIYDAGIKSAKSFVKHKAETLVEIYEDNTQKKADFGAKDLAFSLELARELEKDPSGKTNV